jgi:hypothetical protein
MVKDFRHMVRAVQRWAQEHLRDALTLACYSVSRPGPDLTWRMRCSASTTPRKTMPHSCYSVSPKWNISPNGKRMFLNTSVITAW